MAYNFDYIKQKMEALLDDEVAEIIVDDTWDQIDGLSFDFLDSNQKDQKTAGEKWSAYILD